MDSLANDNNNRHHLMDNPSFYVDRRNHGDIPQELLEFADHFPVSVPVLFANYRLDAATH
jgi:hypothetical protein